MPAAAKPGTGDSPFLVGLIADIQYADCEDGADFSGDQRRYFRNALRVTEAAVSHWNALSVPIIVQLGDVIDGRNARAGASETALRSVLDALNQCRTAERFDLIGNHELYNFRRDQLQRTGLNCTGADGLTYRSTHLGPHWEAIFLDPYELALIGIPEDNAGYIKATELMREHNPKALDMVGGGDWFKDLPEDKHRWCPFNGGFSEAQLAWLEDAVTAAEKEQRSIVVFTHIPLHLPATCPKTLVWNCEEALAILHRHKDSVVAVMAGHDHDGGYAVDPAGLHHITMNSPMTTPPGTDCFAVLECHEGWARFAASGRACVRSGTKGKGEHYSELILARDAENHPQGPSLADLEASEEALSQLLSMGFAKDKASMALTASGGNMEAAVAMCAA